MRDPRIDPTVGDVLRDKLGLLHVVGINERKGVPNVTWERQPVGALRCDCYRLGCALTRWREKTKNAEIVNEG